MTRLLNVAGSGSTLGVSLQNSGSGGNNYSLLATSSGATVGSGKFAVFNDTTGAYGLTLDKFNNLTVISGSVYTPNTYTQIINSGSANTLTIGANNISTMTLDTNGNLGLGVTPSAWYTGSQAFQNSSGAVWQYSGSNIYIGQNYYLNGSLSRIYSTTAAASEYNQSGGAHRWYTAPSNTAGNPITFTQAMMLNASGYLGIGSTNPTYTLTVQGSTGNGISYSDGVVQTYMGTTGSSLAWSGTLTNYPLAFLTNSTERMRIDTNGNLLVGATNPYTTGLSGGISLSSNAVVYSGQYTTSPFIHQLNSTGYGIPQFIGNWRNAGWWGIGPDTSSSSDNTVRVGSITSSASGYNWTGYANIDVAGIKFNGTSNALLSDYEEGTWTIIDESGAGLTFTSATGVYRKIGKLVYVQGDLVFPSTSSSAQIRLSLPYTAATSSNDGSSGGGACDYFSGAGMAQLYVGTASAYAYGYYSTGGLSNVMPNSLASGRELAFAFCYHTSS
jgi:hypothetical protein